MIVERVRAGLRRARLEGRRLGRPPLHVDVAALLRNGERGLSIRELARQHGIAETSVRKRLRQAKPAPSKTSSAPPPQAADNTPPLAAV